ncbi:MAG: DUF6143 family protein [Clostridiaceae bacterium]
MSGIMKKKPIEVVDITNPAKYSMMGKYFIGQTGTLTFGNKLNAWSSLINPKNSGVNLFFDIFTITDFSEHNFTGEIWFNANLSHNVKTSTTVTPSNQGISPPPKPKGLMVFADLSSETPSEGINIFGRIVSANSTLVSDSHKGSMIIGPGSSFTIFLRSPGPQTITGTIVMTWWEEKV